MSDNDFILPELIPYAMVLRSRRGHAIRSGHVAGAGIGIDYSRAGWPGSSGGCWTHAETGKPVCGFAWIDIWRPLAYHGAATAEIRNKTVTDWQHADRALVGRPWRIGPGLEFDRVAKRPYNPDAGDIGRALFDPADAVIDAYEAGTLDEYYADAAGRFALCGGTYGAA